MKWKFKTRVTIIGGEDEGEEDLDTPVLCSFKFKKKISNMYLLFILG